MAHKIANYVATVRGKASARVSAMTPVEEVGTNVTEEVELRDEEPPKVKRRGWTVLRSKIQSSSRLQLTARAFRASVEPLECRGVASITKAHQHKIQGVWLGLLGVSFALMCGFLWASLAEFLNNPILTSFDIVRRTSMPFPEVVICPTNKINYGEAKEKNSYLANYFEDRRGKTQQGTSKSIMSWDNFKRKGSETLFDRVRASPVLFPPYPPERELLSYKDANITVELEDGTRMLASVLLRDRECGPLAVFRNRPRDPNCRSVQRVPPKTTPAPTESPIERGNVVDYFMKNGFWWSSFFEHCSFGGQIRDCGEITKDVFDKDRGKCFLVELGEEQQREPNVGLRLHLDLNVKLYPPLGSGFPRPLADGVSMSIARRMSPASSSQVFAAPGLLTKVELHTTRTKRIDGWSRGRHQRCIDSNDTSINEILNVETYEQGSCDLDCRQQAILAACGCLLAIDPSWIKKSVLANVTQSRPDYPYCIQEDFHLCVNELLTSSNNSAIIGCLDSCEPSCIEWTYRVSTSNLLYPSTVVRQEVQQNSKQGLDMGKLIVDIAFSELAYTAVEQSVSMSLTTFISNVGGIMGAWMGASILTLLQVSVLMLSACFIGKEEPENEDDEEID